MCDCGCQSVRTRSVCVLLLHTALVLFKIPHTLKEVSRKSFSCRHRQICVQIDRCECVSGASCLNEIIFISCFFFLILFYHVCLSFFCVLLHWIIVKCVVFFPLCRWVCLFYLTSLAWTHGLSSAVACVSV